MVKTDSENKIKLCSLRNRSQSKLGERKTRTVSGVDRAGVLFTPELSKTVLQPKESLLSTASEVQIELPHENDFDTITFNSVN